MAQKINRGIWLIRRAHRFTSAGTLALASSLRAREIEFQSMYLSKRFDFGVGPRLLGAELVAGEPQHSELIRADLRSQLDEFSIVGGSETSRGGQIHDQHCWYRRKLAEIYFFAIDVSGLDTVKDTCLQASGASAEPERWRC